MIILSIIINRVHHVADIDSDGENVLVRYLDHGNTLQVGVSDLYEMNKKLLRIPSAVR